jgi:DNA-binding response OmpR family regulator
VNSAAAGAATAQRSVTRYSSRQRLDARQTQRAAAAAQTRPVASAMIPSCVLVKNAGRVMTHRQLLREVWCPGSDDETHYVRVYVNQLRQKIGIDAARPRYLITEPGVGYRLRVEE